MEQMVVHILNPSLIHPLLTDTIGIFTSRLADGGLGEEVVLEGPALDPGSCQASS
jgi:hypothetical protein